MSIKYHFFGKDCIIDRGLADRTNLTRALLEKNFSATKSLFVNQIHGAEVVVIDASEKIHGDQNLPKADALVTNISGIALGIVTADCAPILFFDSEKKIIAVAHAGWRGAKAGVILSTVEAMKKLGAKNISAVIGPMIQQKSYQVSQEFFDDFIAEDVTNKIFFINSATPDKYQFDLPSYVEKKLREAGILEIKNDRVDTYGNEQEFFSFRRSAHREEKNCGRNVSVIEILRGSA